MREEKWAGIYTGAHRTPIEFAQKGGGMSFCTKLEILRMLNGSEYERLIISDSKDEVEK